MRLTSILEELGHALRLLLRRPAFLIVATVTLCLGVFAVVSTYSLIEQALLRPIGLHAESQLVTVGIDADSGPHISSPALYAALRKLPDFSSLGIVGSVHKRSNVSVFGRTTARYVVAANAGFLDTLNIKPYLGRNFLPSTDADAAPQAIISYAMSQQALAAGAPLLGAQLKMRGRSYVVVGVLPEAFPWFEPIDVVINEPVSTNSRDMDMSRYTIARLRPQHPVGVDERVRAAALALLGSFPSIPVEARDALSKLSYGVAPLRQAYVDQVPATSVWLFFLAALMVLAIALINLTILIFLRNISRGHEKAVRMALGSPRFYLILPSMAETCWVGLVSGICGIVLAWLASRWFASLVPAQWLRGGQLAINLNGASLSVAVILLAIGLAGALGLRSQRALIGELVGGGRTGWSRTTSFISRSLVIVQVAIASALLMDASLFLHSLRNINSTPIGFYNQHAVSFSLLMDQPRYDNIEKARRDIHRLQEQLALTVGVHCVTFATRLPVDNSLPFDFRLQDGRSIEAGLNAISPGYLEQLHIPLLAGRTLSAGDGASGTRVALVSKAFAEKYLGRNPLGAHLRSFGGEASSMLQYTVIGIVGDVFQDGPGRPADEQVYLPWEQLPRTVWKVVKDSSELSYVVELQPGVNDLTGKLNATVAAVLPEQAFADPKSLSEVIASTTSANRIALTLALLFSFFALALAAIGLYAVMSVAVSGRTKELGIRAALGASPAGLAKLVLWECATQVGVGLLLGLTLSIASSGLVSSFLFNVSSADPWSMMLLMILLAIVGLGAALVPALRAARIQPMEAMRMD